MIMIRIVGPRQWWEILISWLFLAGVATICALPFVVVYRLFASILFGT